MKIQDVVRCLEAIAPARYQESYDNAGLLTGRMSAEVTGILLSLDATEEVVAEAMARGCNMIISHHPIVFRGLKRLIGDHYVERAVILALKNDIALYAAHTNLDNVRAGVNGMIGDKLGLENAEVLAPLAGTMKKLYTFAPHADAPKVLEALFAAGAGHIGRYGECSYQTEGTGTFLAEEGTHPYKGDIGVRHEEPESRLEVVFPAHLQAGIVKALLAAHPYEEVAYDIVSLDNPHPGIGSGLIGSLPAPMDEKAFLAHVRERLQAEGIRYTRLRGRPVARVAVCGGAGSFLLGKAMARGADAFVSADFKYHEFFDADNQIVIVDVGHYESEQYTVDIFYKILTEEFPTFAPLKSNIRTNPVNYLH